MMTGKSYKAGEVERVTGIRSGSIRQWRHDNRLPIHRGGTWGGDATNPEGAHRWERFAASEVVLLACMQRLIGLGVSTADSYHVVRDHQLLSVIRAEMHLSPGGEDIWLAVYQWPNADRNTEYQLGRVSEIAHEVDRHLTDDGVQTAKLAALNVSDLCREIVAKLKALE